MRTTYHCENCNVKFPAEDERFGMCRECNEGCSFCYECEKKDDKIFELESFNEKMLKKLKRLQNWIKYFEGKCGIRLTDRIRGEFKNKYRLLEIIINRAEGK